MLVREILSEKIKKRGNKWVVTDHSGKDVLGTHDSKGEAQAQLSAIEISKHKNESVQVGKHNNVPDSKFDPHELAIGIKVEYEHTNDRQTAEDIAKDHLSELPDYYSKLIKMEKGKC